MGRTSSCLQRLFTKSTTQINNNRNHLTNYYKPKWITNLLKSCKDINHTRAATADSVVSVATSSKSIKLGVTELHSDSLDGYAIVVDHHSHSKAVEVVRVDSQSGCRLDFDPSRRAAVVIQSVFRGYLVNFDFGFFICLLLFLIYLINCIRLGV